MPVKLDLQNDDGFDGLPAESRFRGWIEAALQESYAELEQTLRIVGEAESRELNRRYRQKDAPTNVLAFPGTEGGSQELPADLPLVLGDIVICGPVVAREADEQGKQAADHWAHMLVHGALHLLGYDHQSEDQASNMESLEARILAAGGLDNPYKSRD